MTTEEQLADLKDRIERLAAQFEQRRDAAIDQVGRFRADADRAESSRGENGPWTVLVPKYALLMIEVSDGVDTFQVPTESQGNRLADLLNATNQPSPEDGVWEWACPDCGATEVRSRFASKESEQG